MLQWISSLKSKRCIALGIIVAVSIISGFCFSLTLTMHGIDIDIDFEKNMTGGLDVLVFLTTLFMWLSLYSVFEKSNKLFYMSLVSFTLIFMIVGAILAFKVPVNILKPLEHPKNKVYFYSNETNFKTINIRCLDLDTGIDAGPLNNFLSIFLHNAMCAILYFIKGFTIIGPFVGLAYGGLIIAGHYVSPIHAWHWKGALLVLGSLHAHLEFPAMFLSFIASVNVSRYMFKAIIDVLRTRRIRGNFGEVKEAIKWGLKILKISIFLLFVAAILETWWTPWWAHQIFP